MKFISVMVKQLSQFNDANRIEFKTIAAIAMITRALLAPRWRTLIIPAILFINFKIDVQNVASFRRSTSEIIRQRLLVKNVWPIAVACASVKTLGILNVLHVQSKTTLTIHSSTSTV